MRCNRIVFTLLALLACTSFTPALAYDADGRDEPRKAALMPPDPSSMKSLQEIKKQEPIIGKKDKDDNLSDIVEEEKDLSLKIRQDAMKEAGMSFGARGGLAFRTKQIMVELQRNSVALDKVYNFRRLLIKAPSNMFIEPPIISEALNNFIVTNDGEEAAVADTIYHITRKARIVSAPRNWHQYLDRVWSEILPPPDILLPENEKERKAWRTWIAQGWQEGYRQADEIFQADLNRMTADFEGMVRYRVLLTQNKVSMPYATLEDRGITGVTDRVTAGSGQQKITSEMRVGDRAIRITAPVTLRPEHATDEWDPPIQNGP
ncbi:MAG: hypothetical protein JWM96_1207 [Alphaproteobacteria bacterium]|nr:hypothetical protein [Alphaproteobacteria bacterium]